MVIPVNIVHFIISVFIWEGEMIKSISYIWGFNLSFWWHLEQNTFPVVMYGCESWTIKKAECQRDDAFELWCWRRLLRVPWMARRSNQSILKKIKPVYILEGLMLKLQYFGHLMQIVDSLEKTLMLGKVKGKRTSGWQKKDEMVRQHHWPSGHEFEQTSGDSGRQRSLICCRACATKSQTQFGDWTTATNHFAMLCSFLLYDRVNELYVYICPLPLKPPFPFQPTSLGHHRALGCVIQKLLHIIFPLAVYFTRDSVYTSMRLSWEIHPTFPFKRGQS